VNRRVWVLLGLVYAVLLIFVGRLWQLQVVQYEQYATRSQGNYLRTEPTIAPRGRILDRNGRVIATNRLAVDLKYKGGDILFKDRILALTGLKELPQVKGEPVDLMVNVPEPLIPTLAELTAGEPNLQLVERMERVYPNPIAGPVIGYTALPSPDQVKDGYDPAELVGAAGLEAALEPYLRGTKGIQLSEVNARGQKVRVEELKAPVAGQDVRLTIDLNLQQAAQKAAQEAVADINRVHTLHGLPTVTQARGAIVAVDPSNGEILAMVTNPAFDPNLFGRRPRPNDQIKALFTDKYQPTLNRAVLPYAPGSTYKLATSSMLLERGYVTAGTTFNCTPFIVFGGVRKNWSPRYWGPFTVKEAIAQSCNTWYYQAAILDPIPMVDKLAQRANELGLGRTTGLEIAEGTGLIPTLEWKRRVNKAEPMWYPGETLSIFIGQGSNQVTPVQIARMLTTIVEDGKQPKFHLVHEVGGQVTKPEYTQVPGQYWQVLKDGLRKTVTWGTSHPVLGNFPVPTGGKTGTAETPGKKLGNEHGWYMGYGPTDPNDGHPPLVVVAFFENSGGGYDVALPAVKKVMTAYWKVGEEVASR